VSPAGLHRFGHNTGTCLDFFAAGGRLVATTTLQLFGNAPCFFSGAPCSFFLGLFAGFGFLFAAGFLGFTLAAFVFFAPGPLFGGFFLVRLIGFLAGAFRHGHALAFVVGGFFRVVLVVFAGS